MIAPRRPCAKPSHAIHPPSYAVVYIVQCRHNRDNQTKPNPPWLWGSCHVSADPCRLWVYKAADVDHLPRAPPIDPPLG